MSPEQEKKLDEIHTCIVGNRELGIKGLASRVETLEGKVQTYGDKFKSLNWSFAKIAAGVAFLSVGGAKLFTQFFSSK